MKNVGNGNGGGGCGCDCGCGGGTKDPSPASLPGATGGPSSGGGPVKVHPVYTADGTGDALDSFASLPTICCKQAPPIGVPIGKTPLAPHIRVNPATGNLVIQWAPPAAATLDAVPLSTYNSDSPSTSVYGAGYTNFYNRSATIQGTSFITVNAGDGTSYAYGPRNFTTNYLTPPPGASNTLFWDLGPIIETQPDGTQYIYGGTGNPRFLTGIKAPNGSTWTVNRDAQTNNVTNVISPAGKRVTWSYAGMPLKLRRVQDSAGRIMTYAVNSSLDLVGVTTADGARTSFGYDANHRLVKWQHPMGGRLSIALAFGYP